MRRNKSEIRAPFLGLHATNPFPANTSSPRCGMFASHMKSQVVLLEHTPRRVISGYEREFNKYGAIDVRMPDDGTIVEIIRNFPMSSRVSPSQFCNKTIVIFENDRTGKYDMFTIPYMALHHQIFTYTFNPVMENMNRLRVGATFKKDTLFAVSPTYGPCGDWMFGRSYNAIHVNGMKQLIEDGFLISQEVADAFSYRTYKTVSMSVGSSTFPLNLWGDENNYKIFPDIGEFVDESSLVMASRKYNTLQTFSDMSAKGVRKSIPHFDNQKWGRLGKKGRVVDVVVIPNRKENKRIPEQCLPQLDRYVKAGDDFRKHLIDFERRIETDRRKRYGDAKIQVSDMLHRELVRAKALYSNNHSYDNDKRPIELVNKKRPLDEYTIWVTIEYINPLRVGNKITDTYGSKGVVCDIWPTENMPIDEDGNRVHIIAASQGIPNRTNPNKLYEQYHAAAARDMSKNVAAMLKAYDTRSVSAMKRIDKSVIDSVLEFIYGYLKIVSPVQAHYLENKTTYDEKLGEIKSIIENWIRPWINFDEDMERSLSPDGSLISDQYSLEAVYGWTPDECEKLSWMGGKQGDIVMALEQHNDGIYKPRKSRLSFIDREGNHITTETEILVGEIYHFLLENLPDVWSAVGIAKSQHLGVLTASERDSLPYKDSPIRDNGESEVRLYTMNVGRRYTAEDMDRAYSSWTQYNMAVNILRSECPGSLPSLVDRNVVPYGGGKNIQMLQHMCLLRGFKLKYVGEKGRWNAVQ